jgi:hypothetical protein
MHSMVRLLRVAVAAATLEGLGVKRLLLLWRERRIEGLGGLATAIGLGGMLGPQGTHAVDSLRGGQLGHVATLQARLAFAGLHGRSECGPGRLLRGRQLELRLELTDTLVPVGLALLVAAHGVRARALTHAVMRLAFWAGLRLCQAG